jgi:hypothetical protein
MLIITITQEAPRLSRWTRWLYRRLFPSVSLVFNDPFELDLKSIHAPLVLPMVGEIVEPEAFKTRHEIKITVNP